MGFCFQQQNRLFQAESYGGHTTLAKMGGRTGRDESPALHGAPPYFCKVPGARSTVWNPCLAWLLCQSPPPSNIL